MTWGQPKRADRTPRRRAFASEGPSPDAAAALKTFAARGWMKGLFLWQWDPDPAAGGPKDDGYTPHRKPA
jgi:hypothetical protein